MPPSPMKGLDAQHMGLRGFSALSVGSPSLSGSVVGYRSSHQQSGCSVSGPLLFVPQVKRAETMPARDSGARKQGIQDIVKRVDTTSEEE